MLILLGLACAQFKYGKVLQACDWDVVGFRSVILAARTLSGINVAMK